MGRSISATQLGVDVLKFTFLSSKLSLQTENQMLRTIGLKHYLHGHGPLSGMFGIAPIDDMPGDMNFISIWMEPSEDDIFHKDALRSFTVMAHVNCPINPALLPECEEEDPWSDEMSITQSLYTVQDTLGEYLPTTHTSLYEAFAEIKNVFNVHLRLNTYIGLENIDYFEDRVEDEAEYFGCSEWEWGYLLNPELPNN